MEGPVFTVIVADDEDEIREAVCSLIDWESIGFRLLGSAGNGQDALQMVELLQPDLLLTDIQMPFITGTALAKQVRQLQPLIQVAFLSGYDDFEYARSAIDNQVISYLLKPISMAELTLALQDIHKKMENLLSAFLPVEEKGDLALAVSTLLLDSFSNSGSEAERRALLHECGMFFTEPYHLTVLCLSTEKMDILPQNTAQIVDKVLRRTYRCGSFVSGRRILSLLISEDSFLHLDELLDKLYYVAKQILGKDCVLGVSRPYSRLDCCSIACREAVDAARLADGPGIQHIGRLRASADEKMQSEQNQSSQFERILFSGNRQEMESFLSVSLRQAAGSLAVMQTFVFVQSVLRPALGNEEMDLLLRQFGLSDPLRAGMDAELFRRQVYELCLAGQEKLSLKMHAGMSTLVDRTLQIIESRYMDEALSLGSVSQELHVSPNYLSANMKKYAGDTFMNLLIQRRMEAAKSMLQHKNMKIGEVAQRCGYSDQHYFSFCFKKYYGMSPAKMRRGEEEAL